MDWFEKIPVEDMYMWRHHLHAYPELSFHEYKTSAYVEERLREMGDIQIERPTETSVLATIQGRKQGKTLLLRADMDALPMQEESGLPYASRIPKVAHTCGHDTHTAMLLATAHVLYALRDTFDGTVKLIFQHGEECYPTGSPQIVSSGLIDDIDAAIALHIVPGLPCGSLHVHEKGAATTAADTFQIHIQGKGSHGSMPQNSVDPIIAAAQIILQLQTIVSRNIDPQEMAVLSICECKAGQAANIIPDTAYLSGTVRTVSEATRKDIEARLRSIVEHVCASYGATAAITYLSAYRSVVNDPALASLVMRSGEEVLGKDRVHAAPLTSASEDFAMYGQLAPLCFAMLGGGLASEGCGYMNHNPQFRIREEAMVNGVKTEVQCALNFLAQT